jgi:hypothetical protein
MINYSNNGNFVHQNMASSTNQQNTSYPSGSKSPTGDATSTTCELSANFNNSVYLSDNKPFVRTKNDYVNNNSINDTFLMQKDTENVKRFSVNNLLQLANYGAGDRNSLGESMCSMLLCFSRNLEIPFQFFGFNFPFLPLGNQENTIFRV